MQHLLSSEKRTLDHWATDQFFFSLAQVRCFWCCLLFTSGLTRGIRHLKSMSRIRLCVVVLDAVTPASVCSLWSSHTLLNGLFLMILYRLRSSLLLVHVFLPHNFLLMCFDTALWEHPAFFAITFWGFTSLWRVSVMVFCTTVRWAVSPWLWSLLNQTERPFKGSGTLCRCFGLISWLECDTLSPQHWTFSQYSNFLRFEIWGFHML